jgi:hypothetical protein
MPSPARTVSPLRIATSRANGARSHGPKTPEGKARSCRNSTKHGLYSRDPLPLDESSADLRSITNEFLSFFPTHDPLERAIIQEMAISRCRILLAISLEQQWMQEAIAVTGSIGNAFAALGETGKYRMLQRLEDRAHRTFRTLLVRLLTRCKTKYDGTNPTAASSRTPNPRSKPPIVPLDPVTTAAQPASTRGHLHKIVPHAGSRSHPPV